MASGLDEVSVLAKELETISTSDSQLYREEGVVGKGAGCIANVEIKEGSLVLREAPQLFQPPSKENPTVEENTHHYALCINAFMEMTKEDQKSYLGLHNKFDTEKTTWSSGMRQKFSALQDQATQITFPDVSQEMVFKVMAIMDTNGFHNGVCLKMSRFNHSCRPNAQYFWNVDTNTRDMRSLRKIKQGEEITVSYIASLLYSREERQAYLRDTYNFDCSCEACDLTEAQVEEEIKKIDEYKEEKLKRQQFQDAAASAPNGKTGQAFMQLELKSLKNMYQTAEDIKTFSKRVLLQDIHFG